MVSTRTKLAALGAGLIVALVIAIFLFLGFSSQRPLKLVLGKTAYRLEVADSPNEREKGLSGRPGLVAGAGMIFVFEEPGRHSLWMKDTGFKLDAIWLDQEKRIVHLEENLKPESYPKVFSPGQEALYIIELPAGTIEKEKLSLGQRVEF